MAELSTLARPYARAAFEYARDNDQIAQWAEQLEVVSAVAADSTLVAVFNDPSLTYEQQAKTLCDVCGDALGDPVRNFIAVLASNKRLALLPEVYLLFTEHKANLEQTVEVEVVSAFDMPDATRDSLAAALGRKLQRQVNVCTSTDSDLLGGVLIRAGDLVIDGSVRGRLDKLAATLNSRN